MALGGATRRVREWIDEHPWASQLKATWDEFTSDDAPVYAAALSFFALFALGGLLVLVLAAARLVWGRTGGARGRLSEVAGAFLGEEQARALEAVIMNAQLPAGGTVTTAWALLVLALAASRAFVYLERSLNRIWDVEPRKDRSIARTARKRAASFAIVMAIGFLLLSSLALTSLLRAAAQAARDVVPFDPLVLAGVRILVSFIAITVAFGALYKYLPDAVIEWRDALVGAVATAVLFLGGQEVISRMLAGSSIVQAFGALATVAVLLLWLYYTTLVLVFGAEFTQVYARRHGKPLRPERDIAERRGRKTAPES